MASWFVGGASRLVGGGRLCSLVTELAEIWQHDGIEPAALCCRVAVVVVCCTTPPAARQPHHNDSYVYESLRVSTIGVATVGSSRQHCEAMGGGPFCYGQITWDDGAVIQTLRPYTHVTVHTAWLVIHHRSQETNDG